MEKLVYYSELYDIYKNLLTEKQRVCFEYYYFNDYSLSEIANLNSTSRSTVSEQINLVVDKLKKLEDKLHIYKQREEIYKVVDSSTREQIERIYRNV